MQKEVHSSPVAMGVHEGNWLISPWTKWSPFRRRYFHMHFRDEIFCILIKISLKFVPKGPIDNNPALF